MKKILYSALCLAGMLAITSCNDYLETSTPSTTDTDFVFSTSETSRAALDGAYEAWRQAAQNQVFGDGLFYASDVAGSDIERHPENFDSQKARHYPESFYQNGAYAGTLNLLGYQKDDDTGAFAMLYAVISKANIVIQLVKASDSFESMIADAQPTQMGQIYGEAVALKATAYRELLRYFGDVPYISGDETDHAGLVGRDSIYDVVLAELIEAAPVMYDLGSIPGVTGKNYFSKTYANGLIGRMALEAGGYQTRRGDITNRTDGKGNLLTFEQMGTENNGATYARRSDWKDLYAIARDHFKAVIDNPGSAKFIEADPRSDGNGRTYGNPYQYFFQQMHDDDNGYADESIYEYSMSQGEKLNNARPYSFGRPTTGGSKNNYPCKNYGQGRINPAFYYGVFDPNDMRRDVACTVTATDGAKGVEILLPFKPGSQGKGGGIAYNKWDENRQKTVWTANQRKSGINGPYMRMSEIYLGYAEACAALGNEGEAKTYLAKIRNRAFGGNGNVDAFIAKEGSLLEAVIDERGFEFAGEGDRRMVLIRTGLIAKKVRQIKELTAQMIQGLQNNGYYQFENGNVISNYIWTKSVDAKSTYSHRLTAQCPADKKDDPVLFPGWRGVNDDWSSYGLDYKTSTPLTNLAIKGLFTKLSDAEIAALEADGYTKANWGADIVSYADEYSKYLFYDYDYVKAPIYFWAFTPNVLNNGGFLNGYGFKNE